MTGSAPVAVITGGSRGIGRALVAEAVRRGFVVVFGYRARVEDARTVEADAAAVGGAALGVQADLARSGSVQRLADEAMRAGPVSVLINNAGVLLEQTLDALQPDAWHEAIAVNLTAPCFLVHALVSELRATRGSIVNISSSGGVAGSLHGPAYGATKAGLIGLPRTLARELAPDVRVNAVAPGPVNTEMYAALSEDQRRAVEVETPMRRVAQPADLAKAVFDLCSWPDCTGQTLVIDGGRVMS